MEDKRLNNSTTTSPDPVSNSSDTFKFTNIYASKANNQADYFAHVKPTFQDKLRAKAKSRKAARTAKAQDPAAQKRRRKVVIIILTSLIVVVSGVLVWLVLANSGSTDDTSGDDTSSSEEINDDTIVAEQRANEAQEEAERLMANNPNNINAVVDYYTSRTTQVIEQNDDNYASAYNLVMQGYQYFTQNNNPQAALDFLKQVDLGVFDGFTQHWFYSKMVELSEQTGDSAARSKYSALVEQTQADYDARVNAAEQDVQHDLSQGYITEEDTR